VGSASGTSAVGKALLSTGRQPHQQQHGQGSYQSERPLGQGLAEDEPPEQGVADAEAGAGEDSLDEADVRADAMHEGPPGR
jgi:hypothetical protein